MGNFKNFFGIQDTKSGLFLHQLWLSEMDASLYATKEEAENELSRLKSSKYINKYGVGYNVNDLIIVELEVKPKGNVKI